MKLELRRVTASTSGARDARRRWPERQSLLVRLSDAGGFSGVGEASPLPGYSPDELADVEEMLSGLDMSRLHAAMAEPDARAALQAAAALAPHGLPSARMALESATLDLLGRRAGIPAPRLLGAESKAARPLASLLGPASSPDLLVRAERALADGFRHLKVKLGGAGELAQELSAVRALREHVGPSIALRLDANTSLTAEEVDRAWTVLTPLDIELFEEPGDVPPTLRGLLPLALDESLQRLNLEAAEARLRGHEARFAVLKPMALGGLTHCRRLAQRAESQGIGVIVSHCFDGPTAFRAAAALALALPAGCAHGLAPHPGSGAFSATSPVYQGSLHVWAEPGLGLELEQLFA